MAHCIPNSSNTSLSLIPHPSFETPPHIAPLTHFPPCCHDDDLSLIHPSAISNLRSPLYTRDLISSRQGTSIIALITPPRTDGKRNLYRALPELRCKSRLISMPSMPAAAWRHGGGTSSHARNLKRGRFRILSLTALLDAHHLCCPTNLHSTL